MSFHLHAGMEILTIRELAEELHHLSDEQFSHHVSGSKNDFAQWIENEHHDAELGREMRAAGSRAEMSAILDRKNGQEHATVEPTRDLDDESFIRLRDEYAERNDRMLDRFDEMSSRIEQALADEIPDEIVKAKDQINERYAELRQKTSELRRIGKDTLIASLMLRQVPSKLQLALAGRELKDLEMVRVLLKQIEAELQDAEKAEVLDVRKEIEAMTTKAYKEDEQGKA